jgi:uncharacterized protein (TIGR02266 family)
MSRVLMIDDAGLLQMLESSFVRRLACDIVRASDGPDMMDKARRTSPDLILLDAERPGLDGPACLRVLKSDPSLRSIPVLVLTSAERAPGLCDAGADATLTRPLGSGVLALALSSVGRFQPRGDHRRIARLPVRVGSPAGSRRGRLKDISRTGLFLALPDPLPVDAPVSLTLRLPEPDGRRRLEARGVVVRQVPSDPESHLIPGVGVRFVDLDAAAAARIERFVVQDPPDTGACAPRDPAARADT